MNSSVVEDKRRLHLDANQTQDLQRAVDKAIENFNISRGVIGCYCVLNSLTEGQAIERMNESDQPMLKRTATVVRAGDVVLEFSGLLSLLDR